MGWFAGMISLTVAALVTFYAYNLLSLVLEYHAQLGQRQLRFRDMASDILGWLNISLFSGLQIGFTSAIPHNINFAYNFDEDLLIRI